MRSVFFNTEVLEAEKKIIRNTGIPSIVLMENAGANSAHLIRKFIRRNKINKCILLAGKGNNAGDGFVIARHLFKDKIDIHIISVYSFKDLKGDALKNYQVICNLERKGTYFAEISSLNDFKKYFERNGISKNYLVIDAVFGVGFKGELDKHLKDIFTYLNSVKNKKIIAIDTVSGLKDFNDSSNLPAVDMTISMACKKFNSIFGKGREISGINKTVNIGIPETEFNKYNSRKIFEVAEDDIRGIIPPRNINSNKYTNGKLFILGGKPGFSGAVCLSAMSAMRTGSGAVIAGVPESINSVMEIKTTEVVTLPLPENKNKCLSAEGFKLISEKIKWSDAALIGPGIGRDTETQKLILKIIDSFDHNFVIDADGLNALKNEKGIFRKKKSKVILTPHYGEFSVISGVPTEKIKKDIYNYAKEFAVANNVILVLKNSPTIITDGDYFYINSTGRENLATIGSGDVLSGIISSVYSITGDAVSSSIFGCYLHGRCGDILYEESGCSSTLAGDLIELIPRIKNELNVE
jgi:NAD(P)H-hydrate epimerase